MKIASLEEEILQLEPDSPEYRTKKEELRKLKKDTYSNLSAWDRVSIARSDKRVKGKTLVNALVKDFFELHGDQYYADDQSILAGVGYLDKLPVTVIAQCKGSSINENIERNFGMTSPEGFRKALRLAKEAEKFSRPILSIVDTSGAYPGKGAEERGQSRAIAENLLAFSKLKTPVLALILSEGGSGGALALTVSDKIYMFENAVYSVLSPEGFSSILFKGKVSPEKASEYMKMTSADLLKMGIVDEVIKEPLGGLHYISEEYIAPVRADLVKEFESLLRLPKDELVRRRYEKFRKIGVED